MTLKNHLLHRSSDRVQEKNGKLCRNFRQYCAEVMIMRKRRQIMGKFVKLIKSCSLGFFQRIKYTLRQGSTLEKILGASSLLSFKIWSPAQIFWLQKIFSPSGQKRFFGKFPQYKLLTDVAFSYRFTQSLCLDFFSAKEK